MSSSPVDQNKKSGTAKADVTDNLYPNKPGFVPATPVPVGGVILLSDPLEYNVGRSTFTLKVKNTGDRPIQVGSHFLMR